MTLAQPTHPVRGNLKLSDLDTGDPRMSAVIARARLAIDDGISVLVEGEAGTGKGVLARAMHASSTRNHGPFVTVNCAALEESDLEIELFGDGSEHCTGQMVQAHGGTLVLNAIHLMPLRLQARLLHSLQNRAVAPVGSGRSLSADCYVIANTETTLRDKVQRGDFRSDLYYRLDRLLLRLPPLRERDDIGGLVEEWLRTRSQIDQDLQVSEEVMALFCRHPWPGNVCQLFNVLHAAAVMTGEDDSIQRNHLPEDFWDELKRSDSTESRPHTPIKPLEAVEARVIKEAVAAHDGNLSAAARALGVSRATLYRKMRRDS